MPSWNRKDERQYEHIKDSELERGASEDRAKEIAARTVNKRRREEGRTPSKRTQGTGNPNVTLEERSRDELYNLAKELDIKGRSKMSKDELSKAIHRVGQEGRQSWWRGSLRGTRGARTRREKTMHYRDRNDAGQQLAEKLMMYANRPDVLVLALPRGGVLLGFAVAEGCTRRSMSFWYVSWESPDTRNWLWVPSPPVECGSSTKTS